MRSTHWLVAVPSDMIHIMMMGAWMTLIGVFTLSPPGPLPFWMIPISIASGLWFGRVLTNRFEVPWRVSGHAAFVATLAGRLQPAA